MNCKIIQDLLPLYHDHVCSQESREAVAEHLQGCEECRRFLADLDAPLPETARKEAGGEASVLRRLSQEWKRKTWRARLKGATAAVAVCALLVLGWIGATELRVFPVPTEKIEISNLRQLSDGRILYHFYINDDRTLRTMIWEFGKDGDVWLLPKRALYTEKRDPVLSPADCDQVLSIPEVNHYYAHYYAQGNETGTEVVRIWYGNGEDRILLWEEGMDLPAASEADEEAYGFDSKSAEYWKNRT